MGALALGLVGHAALNRTIGVNQGWNHAGNIAAALSAGTAVDGHAPAMTGQDLVAYVAAGIRSDHESTTAAEARAKAALGMLVQVREGSLSQLN